MEVRPLHASDLDEVVRLHRRMIDYSLTTRLGPAHVRSVYQTLLEQPHFFGYVCCGEAGLIGVSTATLDYHASRRLLGRLYRQQILRIARHLLTSPQDLINLVETQFIIPRLFRAWPTAAEWLSLVTDVSRRELAPAAAVALIRRTKEHFRQLGVRYFTGQTYARHKDHLVKTYTSIGGRRVQRLLVNDVYVFES